MNTKRSSRPGTLQMLLSVMLSLSIDLAEVAGNNFGVHLNLPDYNTINFAFFLLGILYIIGFVRYGASKGYRRLLLVLLSFCSFIGVIVLLRLPDRNGKTLSSPPPSEPTNWRLLLPGLVALIGILFVVAVVLVRFDSPFASCIYQYAPPWVGQQLIRFCPSNYVVFTTRSGEIDDYGEAVKEKLRTVWRSKVSDGPRIQLDLTNSGKVVGVRVIAPTDDHLSDAEAVAATSRLSFAPIPWFVKGDFISLHLNLGSEMKFKTYMQSPRVIIRADRGIEL